MKLMINIAALLLLSLLAARPIAAETDCRTIEDPDERLACFDANYGTPEAAPAPVEAPIESEKVSEPVAVKTPASVESTPAPVAPAKPAEKKTGFLGDELVDLTSTITAILAGEKQKMVFQLENGQIWLQSSPRPLPFKEGDLVTVKNATFGGYFMRSEKGVSTRVRRIY